MRLQRSLVVLWASLLASCLGITIGPQTGGLGMARILFNGSQDVLSSSSGYSGDPSAIRPFTNGPFGMEKGIILSTGSLTSPFGPGDMCPSSYTTDMYDEYTTTYCGANSYNGAIFLLNVLPTKATTFLVDIIIASCDLASADKVFVFANGVNYAKDENGIALDSSSKYLNEPWGIPAPNGDTAFTMSSPPLRFSIPLPKSYVELKIAVCDRLDGYGDTAVMIKIRPCNDCSQTFKVDYDTTSITSTTTYEAVSTVTQPASGTVRGTISYITYVTPTAASTTLSAPDSSSSTSSATFTSLAPVSCYQMTNPYRLPSGSQFEVNCNSYSTDGDQIGSTLDAIDLSQCIDLCVDTTNCKAALFDRSQSLCYLMDGSDGPVLNNLYDMAVLLSSAPSAATSSTSSDALSTMISSEVTTTTPSSTSPPTPLSCREMAGSIYTGPHENKFTLTCDTVSVGESIYRRAEEDSMEGCVAMCDSDNRCLAVNFYPYPDSECHLVESFASTRSFAGINFAMKLFSSSSTSSSSVSSELMESTLSTTTAEITTLSSLSGSTVTSGSTFVSSSLEADVVTTRDSTLAFTSTTILLSTALLSESESSVSSSSEHLSESTSEASTRPAESPSSLESTADIVTAITGSTNTITDTKLSTTDTSDVKSATTDTPVFETSTLTTLASTTGSTATSSDLSQISQPLITVQSTGSTVEVSDVRTSTTGIPKFGTSTLTTLASATDPTTTTPGLSSSSLFFTPIQSAGSSTMTSEASTLPSTSSVPISSNAERLNKYIFTGCLKSLEGFPSFTEVATDPDMTTRKCVDLAAGSWYIGVYKETCYKADLLSDTELIPDGNCNLRCPGDFVLLCGGDYDSGQRLLHRAIAPDHLLTLYRKTSSPCSMPRKLSTRRKE